MEKLQDIVDELNDSYLSDNKLKKLIVDEYVKYRKTITVTTLQVLINTLKNMDKMDPLPFSQMQCIMLNIYAPQEMIHKLVPNFQQRYYEIIRNQARQNVSNYNKQRQSESHNPYSSGALQYRTEYPMVDIPMTHPGIIPMHVYDPIIHSAFGNSLINNLGGIFK